jgi:hypothetical protein
MEARLVYFTLFFLHTLFSLATLHALRHRHKVRYHNTKLLQYLFVRIRYITWLLLPLAYLYILKAKLTEFLCVLRARPLLSQLKLIIRNW